MKDRWVDGCGGRRSGWKAGKGRKEKSDERRDTLWGNKQVFVKDKHVINFTS